MNQDAMKAPDRPPAFIDEGYIANCLLPTRVFDYGHQVHVMFPTFRAEYKRVAGTRARNGKWELVALQVFASEPSPPDDDGATA